MCRQISRGLDFDEDEGQLPSWTGLWAWNIQWYRSISQYIVSLHRDTYRITGFLLLNTDTLDKAAERTI